MTESEERAKQLVANDMKALRDRIKTNNNDPVAQEKIRQLAERMRKGCGLECQDWDQ